MNQTLKDIAMQDDQKYDVAWKGVSAAKSTGARPEDLVQFLGPTW